MDFGKSEVIYRSGCFVTPDDPGLLLAMAAGNMSKRRQLAIRYEGSDSANQFRKAIIFSYH